MNEIIRKGGVNPNNGNTMENNGLNYNGGQNNQFILKTNGDGYHVKENIPSQTENGKV